MLQPGVFKGSSDNQNEQQQSQSPEFSSPSHDATSTQDSDNQNKQKQSQSPEFSSNFESSAFVYTDENTANIGFASREAENDHEATETFYTPFPKEERKLPVNRLNQLAIEAKMKNVLPDSEKSVQEAKQLKEQDEIFKTFINAKEAAKEYVFKMIEQSKVKLVVGNAEGKTPAEHINTLKNMDHTSQDYKTHYKDVLGSLTAYSQAEGFTTPALLEENAYFYNHVDRKDIECFVGNYLRSRLGEGQESVGSCSE